MPRNPVAPVKNTDLPLRAERTERGEEETEGDLGFSRVVIAMVRSVSGDGGGSDRPPAHRPGGLCGRLLTLREGEERRGEE